MENPWEAIREDAYRIWLQNAPMSAEEFNVLSPMDRRSLRTGFEKQQQDGEFAVALLFLYFCIQMLLRIRK
jgi:hypothetical protein